MAKFWNTYTLNIYNIKHMYTYVHGDWRGEAGEEKQASGAITEALKC